MKKKILIPLVIALFIVSLAHADIYYLSTQGNDSLAGTEQEPFGTLQYSLSQLEPGDILYVRGGTYFQDSIVTNIKGTAGAPIVIQAYPGEEVIFDASFPYYHQVPNNEWVIADVGKNIYRTKKKHSGGWPAAWLIDADQRYNNVQYSPYDVRTNTYKIFSSLRSSTCGDDYYIGPGIVESDSGYIYIRLEQCPGDLIDEYGNPVDPIPLNIDPNQIPIALSKSTFILQLKDAAYVEIRDIQFLHATNMTPWTFDVDSTFHCGYHPFIYCIGNIDISEGSHHITIDNVEVTYGCVGITANGCTDIAIQNSHIYQGMPDWLVWRDVKGGGNQAWPEFNSFAFAGVLVNSSFNNNMIHHTLDGIYIKNGTQDSEVRSNYFWMTRDDAIDFDTYVDNLEVCWNVLRHVYEGISIVGYPYPNGANGGINGEIYIHHNVIDVLKYMRRDRSSQPWDPGKVWGSHSCNDHVGDNCDSNYVNFGIGGDCKKGWTAYNNTIIAQQRDITKNQHLYPTGCKHFKNNIIYCIDNLQYSGCNYCEGNVFWRAIGNSYNPDAYGDSIDPIFNIEILKSSDYSPNIMEYYKPMNLEVLTPGVTLSVTWPESQNDYRGAFGVLRTGGCLAPDSLGIRDITTNSVVLFWSKVDSALDYDIRYRKKMTDTWNEVNEVADTLFQLTNLFQNTNYEWSVRSSCIEGNSLYKDGPDFRTLFDSSLPFVTILASDTSASEEGQDQGSFQLIRNKTEGDLTVYLQISGTASSDDFIETLSDSVIFNDGDSLIQIIITPVDDIRYEGNETIEISLEEKQTYNRTEPYLAVIQIEDNDQEGVEITFIEQGSEVVMEAEHFHKNNYLFDPASYVWSVNNETPGYVGGGYISVPQGGATATWSSTCEVAYLVKFSTTGLYNVWLRRFAHNAGMNSVWIGMDGVQATGNDDQSEGFGEWTWIKIDQIDVSTNGLHNFQIRRREDGYQIDRIVLRISSDTTTEDGPPESPEEIYTLVKEAPDADRPTQFELLKNYPNPFNASTLIRYQMPKKSHVKLVIYNLMGHTVRKLVAGVRPVGSHAVEWDGKDQAGIRVSSGVYICKMEAEEFKKSIELMLLK